LEEKSHTLARRTLEQCCAAASVRIQGIERFVPRVWHGYTNIYSSTPFFTIAIGNKLMDFPQKIYIYGWSLMGGADSFPICFLMIWFCPELMTLRLF
jgi:hypothetical protein